MIVAVKKYSFWNLENPKTTMVSRALSIKLTRVAHLEFIRSSQFLLYSELAIHCHVKGITPPQKKKKKKKKNK